MFNIRDLKISYRNTAGFNDCNLEANSGDVVAVVGESGCGKSSLLNAVAGYMSVSVDNKRIKNIIKRVNIFTDLSLGCYSGSIEYPDKYDISYLPQKSILFENSTIYKNIIHGKNKSSIILSKEDLQDLLTVKYKLNKSVDDLVSDLSGGERQRVAIMRTMISLREGIYLLDEPFNGLDKNNKSRIAELIFNQISETGSICLFVSHDIHDIECFANKYLIFENVSNKSFRCHYFKSYCDLRKTESRYINELIYGDNIINIIKNGKNGFITPDNICIYKNNIYGVCFKARVVALSEISEEVKISIKKSDICEYLKLFNCNIDDDFHSGDYISIRFKNCERLSIDQELHIQIPKLSVSINAP